MTDETKFSAVVERSESGELINIWQYPDKWEARDAAQQKAKDFTGKLFVVMETDQAFRAEPVVQTVYLAYQPKAAAMPAAIASGEDIPI